jgi:hypothetical protein
MSPLITRIYAKGLNRSTQRKQSFFDAETERTPSAKNAKQRESRNLTRNETRARNAVSIEANEVNEEERGSGGRGEDEPANHANLREWV